MKDEKKDVENTEEKFFWIIGIAIIVFLILLLGSLIGLKITRDKINGVSGSLWSNNTNYVVLDDGTKRNTNSDILRTEIDIDNVRFSQFIITQRDNDSGEEAYDSNISFNIENMSEETLESALYIIALYDSNNSKLIDFTFQLENLPARDVLMFRQNLTSPCVDATRIEVEKIR